MATEQPWGGFSPQAFLTTADTVLVGISSDTAGARVPGSAFWAQRVSGGPFTAIGSASAARIDLSGAAPTFFYTNPAQSAYAISGHDALSHRWLLSGSTGMSLTAAGELMVGTTGQINGSYGSSFNLQTSVNGIAVRSSASAYNFATMFNSAGTLSGSISIGGSSTSYNTSSDHRLKRNFRPLQGALDRIKALPVYVFDWIDGPADVRGFKAHEYGEVIPGAATGEKDGMREEEYEIEPPRASDVLGPDGTPVMIPAVMGKRLAPDYQGIDQSKAVPDLVGAVQELSAMVEALQAEVAALKAAR